MNTLDWIAIISAITTSSLNILQIYQFMKQEEIVMRKEKSRGKPLLDLINPKREAMSFSGVEENSGVNPPAGDHAETAMSRISPPRDERDISPLIGDF